MLGGACLSGLPDCPPRAPVLVLRAEIGLSGPITARPLSGLPVVPAKMLLSFLRRQESLRRARERLALDDSPRLLFNGCRERFALDYSPKPLFNGAGERFKAPCSPQLHFNAPGEWVSPFYSPPSL